jgi:CHRD domain
MTLALQPAHIPRALVAATVFTLDGSKLTDEQFASFTSGNLYVNVHSPDHKSGEIRAQLKP